MIKNLHFLLLFIFLHISFQVHALVHCPPSNEIKNEVVTRLTYNSTLYENLEKFIRGNTKIEMPVSVLFTIDFNDIESVERRTQELNNKVGKDYLILDPYQLWLGCSSSNSLKTEIINLAGLEQKIDQLRLQFFLKEKQTRANLINIQAESSKQNQALLELNATKIEAENTKADAEKNQAKAEAKSLDTEDFSSKEIAASLAIVEKYRQELANHNLDFTKTIELRLKEYKQKTNDLVELAAIKHGNIDQLHNAYLRSSAIWRELTLASFSLSSGDHYIEIPNPPTELKIPKTDKNSEIYLDYSLSLSKAIDEYNKALQSHTDLIKQEKEIVAGALLKAGAIRSQLYQTTQKLDPNRIEILSNESIDDLLNEIKIVPFRFIAYVITKIAEFKQKSSVGIKGWIDISKQLIVFIIVISIPLFLFFLLQSFSNALDNWRQKLISRSSLDYRFRTNLAVWLNRVNPYLPWVVMLIAAEMSKGLLNLVGLIELGIFIPYLELYLLYRIFRKILSQVLSSVLVGGNLENFKLKNTAVQSTSRRVGILLFIELALLHATEDAVRRVLVYTFISSTIWYFNFVYFIIEFNKWRNEILQLSDKVLPKRFMKIIVKFKNERLFIIIPPLLLLFNLLYLGGLNLFRWLIRYDFFKQITSEIYKKRLQDKAEDTPSDKLKIKSIPEDYLRYFELSKPPSDSVYVTRSKESFRDVVKEIKSWNSNDSELDAIIIYGDKGIGKTSLLKKVHSEIKDVKTIYHDLLGKISTQVELFKLIGDLLETSFSNPNEFLDIDNKQVKTVLILDNSQNIFLSRQHGLDAYRGLIDLMNLQTKNIFWCLAFNRRSWDYLNGVFGTEHFYGLEFDMRSWSDVEIQKLIEERHRATGYKLSFDKVIEAVHQTDINSSVNQVEAQFFRLLWGQSRGNPRAALILWLSSLRYIGDKRILVSIPEFSRVDELSKMSDETLFVLSAIVRHENLNLEEIISVTNIQAAKIKKAIKYCEDKKLVSISEDNRFRVTPQSQYFVNSYLLGKNFLYE